MTTDPRIEAIAKALFQEIHSGTWVSVGKESHINRYASAIQTLLDDGVIALPDVSKEIKDAEDSAILQMEAMCKTTDFEGNGCNADAILKEFLDNVGCPRLSVLYDSLDTWRA